MGRDRRSARLAAVLACAAVFGSPMIAAAAGVAGPRAQGLAAQASLVTAGGGATRFKTLVFLTAVDGPAVNADVATLTKQLGAPAVKQFVVSFDFAIADALRLLALRRVSLPAPAPAPDPARVREFAAALYAAGSNGWQNIFRAGSMFDTLVSRPLRVQIERDTAVKFGARANAVSALALERFMRTVESRYASE